MIKRDQNGRGRKSLRYIDLFCGIGGFRVAARRVCAERGITAQCVFSSDIDPDAQTAYEANFGERPLGDITKISADAIPDHDILFGGFPCQAFSICGDRRGFEDTRGTLFLKSPGFWTQNDRRRLCWKMSNNWQRMITASRCA